MAASAPAGQIQGDNRPAEPLVSVRGVTGRPLPWLTLVTLLGAFFRFYELWRYPVGLHFDEAANLIDLARIGPSFHPIYFPANNGREPLYFYWALPFARALGGTPQSLRLASAFLGVATIPAVYFCFSQLLRRAEGARRARLVALFAAAVCALLFVHVTFSRVGLRTISLPLAECLAFGLLWRALRRGAKTGAAGWLLVGLSGAACLYTYTAARLLALTLLLFGLYWLISRRTVEQPRGLLLAAAGCAAGCLPLGIYALIDSSSFFQRTAGLAITRPGEVLANLAAVLRMFTIQGSLNGAHNIPGMPLFDWPMRVAFLIGLALLLPRLRHSPYVFILLWLATVTLASVFSPDAPYYIRLTGLIPPAVLIPGLTLALLPEWLASLGSRPGWTRRAWPKALPAALFLAPSAAALSGSAGITYDHYFLRWGPSNDTYFWMMQDKVDAAAYLRHEVSTGRHIFLAPLFWQDWTFQALDRGLGVQSFDPAKCWALPPAGQPAVYAFPPYDLTEPGLLLPHLPPGSSAQPVVNRLGQPVLIRVTPPVAAPASDSGPARPLGVFGGSIALDQVRGLPRRPVPPGAVLRLTLVWRALRRMRTGYTGFVHADDEAHHIRVQSDHLPCGGSFPSSLWTPGERIFDRYTLRLPANAPPGTYRLTAGLYRLPGPVNLTLAGSSQAELPVGQVSLQPG